MAYEKERANLLKELRREGITDPAVLRAIEKVPRELFVPPECRSMAFRNVPLPIGEGQTISQPFVVALMTQALSLCGMETVLEVGTGSGYQCAVLAELSRKVVSIERFESLASSARERLAGLGYTNVEVQVGDGSVGIPDVGPFDAIAVTAASPHVSSALKQQLAEGGKLVAPVGSQQSQELVLYVKQAGALLAHRLGPVRFVPLIGEEGWRENSA